MTTELQILCQNCKKPKEEHTASYYGDTFFCDTIFGEIKEFEPSKQSRTIACPKCGFYVEVIDKKKNWKCNRCGNTFQEGMPLEKELTTWISQDGSVETKLMPKNTGFEIENYEGTFDGFKHILKSYFLKIKDTDSVKVKMHFQVTKVAKL